MAETNSKQAIIDEVARLMSELDEDSCETLLERAQSYHRIMTKPISFMVTHASGDGEKPLCGQGHYTGNIQIVSIEEFEQLNGPKCRKCFYSIKKLRGEKIPYKRENWLMKSQEELIIAIYFASGKKTTKWCTVEELFERTNYKTRETLREALRRLKRHGVVEMKRVGRESNVRLALDCIVELEEGEFIVAPGKIYDAERAKRVRKG